MQSGQSLPPLVRATEWQTAAKVRKYQGAAVVVVTAPARLFALDTNSFDDNEVLSLVLAQTPDVVQFGFDYDANNRLRVRALPGLGSQHAKETLRFGI